MFRPVAGFLMAMALAGCFGAGHPTALGPGPTAAVGEGATVAGWVVSDEATPVADVFLLLQPGDLNATTDAQGHFHFASVIAGHYALAAAKLGFLDAKIDVFVAGLQDVTRNLTMVRVATKEPFHRVVGPYTGYFQCYWSFPLANGPCGVVRQCAGGECADTTPAGEALWTQDQDAMTFRLENEAWKTIVFEARWTPGVAATSPRMALLLSYEGRPADHLFTRSQPSASPLRHVYQNGPNQGGVFPTGTPHLPRVDDTLLAWMTLHTDGGVGGPEQTTAALALEVHFELFATVFYGQAAPEGYTAFTG